MKEKPLCTIILPTIGRPKYFPAALASVAAQTYRPLSILVSDNAANPPIEIPKLKLKEGAPEVNLRLVRRPTRMAIPDHINLCLKEADGEYVFLMSDDDLIVPGYVGAAMECISSEPSVGVVVARQTEIGESFFGPVSNFSISFKTLPGSEYATRWFNRVNTGVSTVFPMLARRRQVLECGGFPDYPTGSYCDITLFLKLCLGLSMGILDGGYYYRVYPTSEGLAAPWQGLLMATSCYERDLLDLHKQSRLERKLLLAIIRGNTGLLLSRWKRLYRRRPGFENKLRPLFDLALRTLNLSWRHGLGAQPKLHKYGGFD